MIKTLVGVILGIVLTGLIAVVSAKNLMFTITPSPFGVEETAARIQANIQKMESHGWKLSGLRDPGRAVATAAMCFRCCWSRHAAPSIPGRC